MVKKRKINEDVNKTEVKNIVRDKLDDFLKEREFKKMVRSIAADVIEDFFQQMWLKKGFWKSGLKNG